MLGPAVSSFNYAQCIDAEDESVLAAYRAHHADARPKKLSTALFKAALVTGPLAALLLTASAPATP